MHESHDVVVVGGGHNSLIAAAYLAAAGLSVLVLEARDVLGGNTVTEELTLPGFKHDTCSSAHVLIQSNPLIRNDELDLKVHGLEYVYTDPAVLLPMEDGSTVVVHRSVERTAAEFATWSDRDAEAFVSFMGEWTGGLREAHARWNAMELDPARNRADARYLELRAGSALETIHDRFVHQRSRDVLAWLSMATIQRIDRPGTGVLPFSITSGRTSFGWATPLGGSGALPLALERKIRSHGGEVLLSSAVERITIEDGRAVGVITEDGRAYRASRAVLTSAHLTHLPAMLAGSGAEGAISEISSRWHPGLSLFAVHIATKGQIEYATGAGVVQSVAGGFGSERGILEQFAAFDRGDWDASDPWLLVVCSTSIDPDRAPEGQGTVKFLTIAPYGLSQSRSWETEKHRYAEALLKRVQGGLRGLDSDSLLMTVPESPLDLEAINRHNVGGSCHGGEFDDGSAEGQVGWTSYRLPIDGLYQTGSTAHPGGSVAGRVGRNAARTMLQDLGLDPLEVMGAE